MLRNSKKETLFAYVLIAPFVAIYGLIFVYPTIDMFILLFQDAPLIGAGEFTGIDNYERLPGDRRFGTAFWNTAYFVLLTVIPGTLVALGIALGVTRLSGRTQALVLALFFLPYILPVSVVFRLWDWTLNFQFGIAMHVLDALGMDRIPIFKTTTWFMPAVALVTIWWGPAAFRSCCFWPVCGPSRKRSTRPRRWTTHRGGGCFDTSPGRCCGPSRRWC